MNKYAKTETHAGHNGTINGVHGRKRQRRENEELRAQSRLEHPEVYNPVARLRRLDLKGLTAKRERARLNRALGSTKGVRAMEVA